jgi:predicted AlkP superfamily pyrophosphatase or phosphodiesterase
LKKLSALLLGGLSICVGATSQKASANTEAKPYVIVISLDGLPARALEDPMLPMPTLRLLASHGSFATAMRPINPTVTWPNHTTLVTGVDASKHHVMANGLIKFSANEAEPEIEPWINKDKLVHAHTLYEAAAEKGLTTGQVDWVAIYGARGVTWHFGEKPDPASPISQELVSQGILTQDQVAHFGAGSSPAWRDEIWTDAAVDIIEQHAPNLLLLHLLQTDSIQHMYAPMTPAAYVAYAYADTCIARVVEAVRKEGLLDRTTFFIVSDHGFASFTHSIHINVALQQQGLLRREGDRYAGSVLVKAEGGAAQVFIPDTKQRALLLPRLKTYLESLPGVAHVYTNEEALAIGLPSEHDTDQAPQLFLTADRDYAFSDDAADSLVTTHPAEGQHGYLNTDSDMQALFVASGAHIRQGVQLGAITNLRIAPTVAAVLGVDLRSAQEKPLTEILK